MNRQRAHQARQRMIYAAAIFGGAGLAISLPIHYATGRTVAGVALIAAGLAQFAENLIWPPREPREPLDEAYYAQPLRRRVWHRLIGVRYRGPQVPLGPGPHDPAHVPTVYQPGQWVPETYRRNEED